MRAGGQEGASGAWQAVPACSSEPATPCAASCGGDPGSRRLLPGGTLPWGSARTPPANRSPGAGVGGGGGPGRKVPAVAQAGGLVFGNSPQRTCTTFLEVVSMTAEADCGEGNAGQPGRDSTWATGRGLTKDLKTQLPSGQCQPRSLGWSDRQPRFGIFSERSPHMSGKFSSVHVQRAFCVPCFQAAYKV